MAAGSNSEKRWSIAACTVAVVAALGGSTLASNDSQTIEQIQNYCRASWRNAGIAQQEWSDCTQQAFSELIGRVSSERLHAAIRENDSLERQELNRTVWRIIQRWRRSPRLFTLDGDWSSINHGAQTADWEEVLAAAPKCLSKRQIAILQRLREGWRVHEIAAKLNISAARVSDEKYNAIKILRERLAS